MAPRHGHYCKDQCFQAGLDHAKHFNVGTIAFSTPLLRYVCSMLVNLSMKWLRWHITTVVEHLGLIVWVGSKRRVYNLVYYVGDRNPLFCIRADLP